MEKLLDYESDEAKVIISNRGYLKNHSKDDVILVLKNALHKSYELLYGWLDGIEFEYKLTKKKYDFIDRKMIFYFSEYDNVNDLNYQVSNIVGEMKDEFQTTKNVENIVPFAYEFLYENKPVHYHMTILEHFQHENFVFVKISYDVKKHGRKRNGYSNSYHEKETREIIIEKWFKDNVPQYKTKVKGFMEQFKNHKKAVTAPKAYEIKIANPIIEESSIYDLKAIAEIKSNKEGTYIEIQTQIKVDGLCLQAVIKPIVSYNDGKYVKISFIKDELRNQRLIREILDSKYFQINQYDGLEEIDDLPVAIKLIIKEDSLMKLPFDIVANSDNDIFMAVSEDESQILDELNFTYLTTKLIHATCEAAEYEVRWNINFQKSNGSKLLFFAKYEDCWVATDERNKKVREMREASKFADDLTKDWELQFSEGG